MYMKKLLKIIKKKIYGSGWLALAWVIISDKYYYLVLQILSQRKRKFLIYLQDVWKMSQLLITEPDVVTKSGRRRQIFNVLETSDLRRFEDVQFMRSWKDRIYNVMKTSGLRSLKDVWFRLSSRHPICNVLKTSDSQRFDDVWKASRKTSLKTKTVMLKTSQRRLGDKENFYWGISGSNKPKSALASIFHKSISDASKTNTRHIK